jgi:SAM-dependent methyltransferase
MNKFFLNLGMQPLANNYLNYFKKNQTKYNLSLFFNTKTKLVSISKRIPSKKMFNNKYPYKSSMSETMKKSFYNLSIEIKKRFNPKIFLEIGSNDGALIFNFSKDKAIGIEPCNNLAKLTRKKGFKTFNSYWNISTAKELRKKYKNFDLIYSANTITHISDLDDVFKAFSIALSDNGILIIEDPSLLECLKKVSYDQFYNEHIYVFSTLALKNILNEYNFELFDVKNLKTHGGSLRYYIKRKKNNIYKIKNSVQKQINKEVSFGLSKFSTYKRFALKTNRSKIELIKLLYKIKNSGNSIIGYGATAKVTTVLNYCNINNNLIDFFLDTTPDKFNKFIPGKKIKIYEYNKNYLNKINYILLGAWNFKKEIFKKEKKFIKGGGKFISHVPYPKIL